MHDHGTVADCDFSGPNAACPACGYVGSVGMRRNCDRRMIERAPRLPPLHKRLANFTKAAIEHAKAGSPTCTQEQIDERHGICMACDIYLPSVDNPAIGNCTHSSCGCPVTRLDKFVSKLAWADQSCPLGKWLSLVPASSLAKVDGPGIIRN